METVKVETVKIKNNSGSVTNIGPIAMGQDFVRLMPGETVEVSKKTLELYAGNAAFEARFLARELEFVPDEPVIVSTPQNPEGVAVPPAE